MDDEDEDSADVLDFLAGLGLDSDDDVEDVMAADKAQHERSERTAQLALRSGASKLRAVHAFTSAASGALRRPSMTLTRGVSLKAPDSDETRQGRDSSSEDEDETHSNAAPKRVGAGGSSNVPPPLSLPQGRRMSMIGAAASRASGIFGGGGGAQQ